MKTNRPLAGALALSSILLGAAGFAAVMAHAGGFWPLLGFPASAVAAVGGWLALGAPRTRHDLAPARVPRD